MPVNSVIQSKTIMFKPLFRLPKLLTSPVRTMAQAWQPDLTLDELNKWQYPNSQFIEVDDARIHLVQSGQCHLQKTHPTSDDVNPTLVLLHGTSASLHTWDGWVTALEKNYCLLRIDLPGFGLTGPYNNPQKTYSLSEYVDTVIAVLNELKINKAIIAGNSLGGGIAWLTALRHPERIEKLILVDAIGFSFAPKKIPIGFRLARYGLLSLLVTRLLPKDMVHSSVNSVYGDKSKVTEALVDRYFDLARRKGNREALLKRMSGRHSLDEIDELSHIQQPTLILWGDKDNLTPINQGYQFERALPNSKLVVFDGLGHVPHEEDAQITVAVVEKFLRDEK